MATNFPGSLDSYVNPVGSDGLASGAGGVSHANMHANIHDAVEAIQAKVGVDNSTVSSSLDFRVGLTERGAPVGAISMFAGVAAPAGWLLCQGQQVDYATYPLLGSVFGVSGGTWYLPDLRQRVPVGSGAGYTLRSTGGNQEVSITIAEANLPTHVHSIEHDHPAKTSGANSRGHDHSIQHNHDAETFNISTSPHAHTTTFYNSGALLGAHSDEGHGGTPSNTVTTDSTTVTGSVNVDLKNYTGSSGSESQDHTHTVDLDNFTGNSGDGGFANTALDIDVRQPFFVVNFIIRVDDI